ncbi:hypothetical protein BT67DRAFT_75739 [Trichocladium antarcticum]|uniref:Uncharacterized protein n=1 Tax=Trichocladium antarcticum TaxID=1450529 RepID=A0AAN6UJ83_9PEZI|nr:hypothetical protein BT67DRAFT_75739 [Trichocladium antarcticum]
MGSALSRCSSRNSTNPPPGLGERGQKMFDRQPNWLVPPSRWRRHGTHQPVRYRTPTPYPKDGRKQLGDDQLVGSHIPEKIPVIETPVVSHLGVAEQPRKRRPNRHPAQSSVQRPQAPLKITWEQSPRLNRFERVP